MNKITIDSTVLTLLMTILAICDSVVTERIVEYEDPVMSKLLNGDSFDSNQNEILGDPPIFNQGIWKCGVCDVLDERKLSHREFYTVDKDVDDEQFQVQVALALDYTKCVTIVSASHIVLHLVSGACDGTHVTFNIEHATTFTVNVYTF